MKIQKERTDPEAKKINIYIYFKILQFCVFPFIWALLLTCSILLQFTIFVYLSKFLFSIQLLISLIIINIWLVGINQGYSHENLRLFQECNLYHWINLKLKSFVSFYLRFDFSKLFSCKFTFYLSLLKPNFNIIFYVWDYNFYVISISIFCNLFI